MNRILRWAVRLFPRQFRDRYASEVIGHLKEHTRDIKRRQGWIGVVRLCLFQAGDLVQSAWEERKAESHSARIVGKRVATSLGASLTQDLWFAFRSVRQRPGFSAIAALTVGLGIGSTTAMYSVLKVAVLEPLPYHEADNLVSVAHLAPGLENSRLPQSAATFKTYRDEQRVFETIGLWTRSQINVSGAGAPERVDAIWMTAEVFQALRVRPTLGAPFGNVKLEEGITLPAVISHGFWQRRFGGDPDIVGKTFQSDNLTWEICGVMPADFTFLDTKPSVYLPTFLPEAGSSVIGKFDYEGIARLKPGKTLTEANDDVNRMIPLSVERFAWTTPSDLAEWRLSANVYPLENVVVGDVRPVLWVLFGTFFIVLLVASANVANLFLVRAESRQHEIALRAAVGASRARVLRLFLGESLLIGLAGGVVGTGLAYASTQLLIRLAPSDLPNIEQISINASVLTFALLLSVVTGILCGLLPVIQYTTPNLATSLKNGSRTASDRKQRHWMRTMLAAAEVALALVLVIGSGLLVRSFQALKAVDPGFDRPEELLSFRLTVPILDHYLDPDGTVQFTEDVLQRLGAYPAITGASAISALPIGGNSLTHAVYVEDYPTAADRLPPLRRYKGIAADYFRTMGIPVLAGRELTWGDIRGLQPVGVVTENFAKEYWDRPNDAIGKRFRLDPNDRWHEIVGVVGDVHDAGLQEDAPTIVYLPMAADQLAGFETWIRRSMTYVVRTGGRDPAAVLPEVVRVVASLKPNVPVAEGQAIADVVERSVARTTFTLIMLGIGAVVAVVIGAVGVYGVISYIFAQRTREIGVRLALGAKRLDVTWLVFRHAGLIVGTGVVVGLVSAVGITRVLSTLLFGVTPADPLSFCGAICLVVIVSVLASSLPARKALAVDPVLSLRSE